MPDNYGFLINERVSKRTPHFSKVSKIFNTDAYPLRSALTGLPLQGLIKIAIVPSIAPILEVGGITLSPQYKSAGFPSLLTS